MKSDYLTKQEFADLLAANNSFLIEQIGDMFARHVEYVEGRFNELEARLDNLETRFDNLERRFDVLEKRFDKLEMRFDVLEVRFDNLETRFENLENRFDVLTTDQHQWKQHIAQIEKRWLKAHG